MIRVPLGRLLATPAAMAACAAAGVDPSRLLDRHRVGDWGDLCAEDRRANDHALRNEERLLSSYNVLPGGGKVWIITEWDRSATTILLPSDY